MAASDKDIVISPQRGSTTNDPSIVFTGDGNDPININVLDSTTGSLSFEGSAGQLFSITNNLTSGSIFSVNDVSGIPSLDINADGTILLAEFSGDVGIGTDNPTSKLDINGTVTATTFESTQATGTAPFTVASTTVVSNLNSDLLDGQHGSYYLNYNNFTNTPTIPTNNNQLTNGAGYAPINLTSYNGTYNIPIYTNGSLYPNPTAGGVTIGGSSGQITTPGNIKASNFLGKGTATSNTTFTHGIGTTDPSMSLWGRDHNDYKGHIHLVARSSNSASDSGQIRFYDYTGSTWQLNMLIDKSGNVGINQSDPGAKLDINGSLSTDAYAIWTETPATGTGGSNGGVILKTNPNQSSSDLSGSYIYRVRAVVKSTGTDTGATWLVYYKESSSAYEVRLVNRSGTSSNHPRLRIAGQNNNQMQLYTTHQNSYNVRVITERFYTDEPDSTLHAMGSDYHWQRSINNLYYLDGDVGINKSDPGAKLHVHGTAIIGGTNTTDRRADFDTDGRLSLSYGDNSNNSVLTLKNTNTYATTNHGANILWQFGTNASSTAISAGRIDVIKEQQWTSTASTQDSALAINLTQNGTLGEKVRITSAGKVGIGTDNPQADLEVVGTTGTASTIFINAPTHNSSVVSEAVLKFGYAHSGSPDAVSEIKLVEGSTNSFGGHLTFSVPSNNDSGGSSTSEALRIHSNGNIGIGTDNPQADLHIESTGPGIRLSDTNNSGAYAFFDANAANAIIHADKDDQVSNSRVAFAVDNDEKVRITSDGKVCIAHNSTLHSGNLQVSTSGADAIDINSYSSSADNGGRLSFYRSKNATIGVNTIVVDGDSLGRIDFRGYNSSGNSYNQGATIEAKVDGSVNSTTDMPTAILFKTSADGSSSPTERLRITSDGTIQLSNLSSTYTSGTATRFSLYNDTNNHYGLHVGSSFDLNYNAGGSVANGKGEHVFHTAAAERLRITSGGLVGINTTNPSTLLHAHNGAIRVTNAAKTNVVELTTDGNIEIKRTGGGAFIDFADATNQDFDARIQHNTGLDFSTGIHGDSNNPPQTRLTIDNDGRLLLRTGTTTSTNRAGGFHNALQVEGTGATSSSVAIIRNSNDVNSPYLNFGKSRGTSVGSGITVNNNDTLAIIDFTGSDGSGSFNSHASIRAFVDGTPGNGDSPGKITFWTTPDNSTTPAERLTIKSNGNIGINATNPGVKLHIVDTVQATDNGHSQVLIIGDDSGTDGESSAIFMGATNATNRGIKILSERQSSNNNHDLIFQTSPNGSVPTEKLRITGVGTVRIPDNGKFVAGTDDDIEIYHSSGHSYIENSQGTLYIRGASGDHVRIQAKSGEESIVAASNGTVELHYDNSKKFETLSGGVKATGNIDLTSELNFTGVNHKYVDFYTKNSEGTAYAANLRLVNHDSTSFHTAIKMIRDGAVELYHNNSKKFETTSTGVRIGTVIDINNYDTLNNGTLSFEGSAGQLFSITNNLSSGSIFSVNDVSGIPSIDVNADGTILLAEFSGDVGIGTDNPTSKLDVNGTATATTFKSTQATGTAPFTVASTTKVTNLNADKLDGQEGTYYLNYNNFTNTPTIPTNNNQLTNGAGYAPINTSSYNGTYNIPIYTSGSLYPNPTAGGVTITGTSSQINTPSHGNSSQWNTAYGWGNHASAGYITSFDITTQTDPKYLRSDTSDEMAGTLTLNSGGTNTYGWIKGYQNNNHFITMRANVTGSTSSPTVTAGHYHNYVEYLNSDSAGFYFKRSDTGTYTDVAKITRTGIYFGSNKVFHDGYHPEADKVKLSDSSGGDKKVLLVSNTAQENEYIEPLIGDGENLIFNIDTGDLTLTGDLLFTGFNIKTGVTTTTGAGINTNFYGEDITGSGSSVTLIEENADGGMVFRSSNGGQGAGALQFYDADWRPKLKIRSGVNNGVELFHGESGMVMKTTSGFSGAGIGVTVFGDLFVGDGDNSLTPPQNSDGSGSIFIAGDLTVNGTCSTLESKTTDFSVGNSSDADGFRFKTSGLHEIGRNVGSNTAVFKVFGRNGDFKVKGNGSIQAGGNNFGGTSDINLKENIVDANSQWDDIKDIRVRNFNFKSSTGYSTHRQIGVIAQEIELVSPGLVSDINEEDNDGNITETTKSVAYSVLYMKAVKALQEAMERIETLEAKVAALESGN